MKKKGAIYFMLFLLVLGGTLTQSHALTNLIDEETLNPGGRSVSLTSLLDIVTTELYGFDLYASQPIQFWIMNYSEYNKMQTLTNYVPECILNITTTRYYNQSFRFPADGDYVYGFTNNGSLPSDIDLTITRPGFYIDGFLMLWVLIGVTFTIGLVFYYHTKRGKRFLDFLRR